GSCAPTLAVPQDIKRYACPDGCNRLVRGTPASRYSIWSARMRRLRRMKCSCRLGTYGTYISGMSACSGDRLPLRVLQLRHAVTELVHESRPPRDTGRT